MVVNPFKTRLFAAAQPPTNPFPPPLQVARGPPSRTVLPGRNLVLPVLWSGQDTVACVFAGRKKCHYSSDLKLDKPDIAATSLR